LTAVLFALPRLPERLARIARVLLGLALLGYLVLLGLGAVQ